MKVIYVDKKNDCSQIVDAKSVSCDWQNFIADISTIGGDLISVDLDCIQIVIDQRTY